MLWVSRNRAALPLLRNQAFVNTSGESSYSLGYVTKHWLVWHVKLNQKELS
ncbi:hypothetical protein ACOSQ3_008557 [Xanthoceras sorbifolium]